MYIIWSMLLVLNTCPRWLLNPQSQWTFFPVCLSHTMGELRIFILLLISTVLAFPQDDQKSRQFGNRPQFGGQFGEQTTEEDVEEESTSPGPGALGILSGLFGIFNGIAGVNPNKVLESTVNFYPPHLKPKAQEELNKLLGRTTKKPPMNYTEIVFVEREFYKGVNNSNVTVTRILPKTTVATTKVTSTTEEEEEDEDYGL